MNKNVQYEKSRKSYHIHLGYTIDVARDEFLRGY